MSIDQTENTNKKKRSSQDDAEKQERKRQKKLKKMAVKEAQDDNNSNDVSGSQETESQQVDINRKEKKEEKDKKDKKKDKKEKKEKKGKKTQDDDNTVDNTLAESDNVIDESEAVDASKESKESKRKNKKEKKEKKEKKDDNTESTLLSSAAECSKFIQDNSISYDPPDVTSKYPPVLSFDSLEVVDEIRTFLSQFKSPTIVQSTSWSILLKNTDCIAIAETGSGKTFAFGVPALQHIVQKPNFKPKRQIPTVLVVAPTRELAMQTHESIAQLGKPLGIRATCVYGGVSKDSQRSEIGKGVSVVVGTPGRLLDLVNEGVIDLSNVSWAVLDEADRMLDKGFENDIRTILSKCLPPPSSATSVRGVDARTTSMFSATWPFSVRQLASSLMISPVRITIGTDDLTASGSVHQEVKVLNDQYQKEPSLTSVLKEHGMGLNSKSQDKAVIFALYKKEAARLESSLSRQGYQVCCIQGDLSQEKRTKALADFKEGRKTLLVATDVAARGLDIPKVELVVNYTFPLTIEDYIHRIGRTGRAGKKGKSVTFFTDNEKGLAGELQKVLRESGHEVPAELAAFDGTIKKKTHSVYGSHFRTDIGGTAKKIRFD